MAKPRTAKTPTLEELCEACMTLEVHKKLAASAREKNPKFAATLDRYALEVERWLEYWAERLDENGRSASPQEPPPERPCP